MKPKRRLVAEEELPPIVFSLDKEALAKEETEELDKQEPFFRSYFDKGYSK